MSLFQKKEPITVEVKGKELVCPICSNNYFWTRSAQLNTSAATFFGLDWANRSATCFVCSECTHIHWFLG
ncbi:MAG: hypothetical protein CFE25_03710 [Chitinophagaceae bacterium BSSC1]|nr:MAG: hypothetical protein CFE25_03710 [Chitinophagaceae bacterium BSSC1]